MDESKRLNSLSQRSEEEKYLHFICICARDVNSVRHLVAKSSEFSPTMDVSSFVATKDSYTHTYSRDSDARNTSKLNNVVSVVVAHTHEMENLFSLAL